MQSLSPLLCALADLLAAEPRPEAQATANLLRAARDHPFSPAPPNPLDAEIRALAQSQDAHPVARALLAAQSHLPWTASPLAAQQSAHLTRAKAVATLLGPQGPILSDHYLFGLFYMAPGLYYPLHAHEAAETYVLIAGTAEWQAGSTRLTLSTGDAIHHTPQMPHAMRAGTKGFLAIWRWSGDIAFGSYQMLPDPLSAAP